jgi:CheY-like chemotaxis protein
MNRGETMGLQNRKVLIVEDERDIASLLELHLRDANCSVTLAADGHEGMHQAFAQNWDLVILDLRLPGPDGLTICRAMRRESAYVPILMLTSKSSELDRVLGLELGADDYVTKPFSVSELMARVKAIFRRVESLEKRFPGGEENLTIGPLQIDTGGRQPPASLTCCCTSPGTRDGSIHAHNCLTVSGAMDMTATNTRSIPTSTVCAPRSNRTPPTPSLSSPSGVSATSWMQHPACARFNGDPETS